MKRIMIVAMFLAAGTFLSGCASAGVQAYSDSILSDQFNGEATRANIVENSSDWTINTAEWQAIPMTAMAAGTPLAHPFADGRPLGNATVTVFSFGTNDANYAAIGQGYSVAAAKLHALNWMKRAYQGGSKCVVWVLGNHDAYQGQPWQPAYRAYLADFNNWITTLGGQVSVAGFTGKFRYVDWGASARQHPVSQPYAATVDGIHPNALGAAAMGQSIKQQVKSCAV